MLNHVGFTPNTMDPLNDDPFQQKSFWNERLGGLSSQRINKKKYLRPGQLETNEHVLESAEYSDTLVKENGDQDSDTVGHGSRGIKHGSREEKSDFKFHKQFSIQSMSLSLTEPFKVETIKRLFIDSVENEEMVQSLW